MRIRVISKTDDYIAQPYLTTLFLQNAKKSVEVYLE